MSRFRNTARSLASGYMAMAGNTIYTLASVPLALHYLSKAEIGLWALATQVAGYLLWIDFGITSAVARILIDHKDDREGGGYGSVIKTALLVLTVQGALIAIAGCAFSFWAPSLMDVPPEYARQCRILLAGQCVLIGVFFNSRVLSGLLQAHQRFDVVNHSGTAQLLMALGVQWLAFHEGMGIYSLLAGAAVQYPVGIACNIIWVRKLRLLPSGAAWGRASWARFKEVFSFGSDLFLMSVGNQLMNASQVIVLTRTLGLPAAAIWTIATKVYPLAFQLVSRIYDFSSSALSEMVARDEHAGLQRRFRDVFVLTASSAVFVGAGVAICNSSFLAVWTGKSISWPVYNDLLLGLLLALTCVTRCHLCLVGTTMQVGGMRFIYFAEGVTFVAACLYTVRHWGITGLLISAIAADALWMGLYGFWRTARYFEVAPREILFKWLGSAWKYLLLMAPISFAIWWATLALSPLPRLIAGGAAFGIAGTGLLWFVGLTPQLRQELKGRLGNLMPKREVAPSGSYSK